jgi:hypothetical protein
MRCDGAGPDSASSQPVMARASSLWTAISQHSHRWPRRSSLRDDDRPGGFSRPGGRARGGCRASGPIRRFTRASPTRHARGGEWTSPRGDIVAIRMTGSTTTPTRQMSAGAGKGSSKNILHLNGAPVY